jgi:aldehyde dehydrogenase (NAD+)
VSAQSGERRLLIDGKLVDSESGNTFENINPATEEVLAEFRQATGLPLTRVPVRPDDILGLA